MRTIIVDDEPDALNSIKIILKEYLTELELVGAFTDSEEALQKIPQLNPELVFLDIHLTGMDAFQLLEKLETKNFHIIFVTAHDEYAIKAFKYNAIDYLLKPISISEIISAVKKIIENKKKQNYEQKYKHLLETIKQNNNQAQEKLILSTIEGIYYIDPDDILYVNADANYSKIIFKDAKPLVISKKIGELYEELPKEYFFRNHHSYLVNLNYVHRYARNDGGAIEMINGDQIPLARRKKNEFHEKMKYLVRKSI